MKNYTTISKAALVICFGLIILAVVNGMTGFINSTISLGGTAVCVIGIFYSDICNYSIRKRKNKKETQINSGSANRKNTGETVMGIKNSICLRSG